MITAVGPTGIARAIELRSESVGKNEPVAKVDAAGPEASGAVTTPAQPHHADRRASSSSTVGVGANR